MPASSSKATKREHDRHTVANAASRRPSMFAMMREAWKAFRGDRPGERFRNHYRRLRESGSATLRVIALLTGAVLIAGGVILLFLPGPGLLFLVFGLALFAGESRTLAGWLDRAEPPVRRRLAAIRRRWRQISGRPGR